MAIRPDYDIGTVTLVASSANFTTLGSALEIAKVSAGDAIITPSGHVLIIASVTGQNNGTLFLPCPAGAAGTDLPLRIRFQPDGSRYQGAVRNLVDLLSSGNIEAFAALIGADGMVPIFTGVGTMDLADPAKFGIQDPNDTLAKFAALTLGSRQILQTDESGALKAIALAANKFLRTDANGDLALSDLGSAAIALLNLSGTAAADRLPYLTGANAAGLTVLSAFARTILDDTSGAAMWATMGGVDNAAYKKLPGGLIFQTGSVTQTGTDYRINFPSAFPTACMWVKARSTYPIEGIQYLGIATTGKTASGVDIRVRNMVNGGTVQPQGSVPVEWFAVGY